MIEHDLAENIFLFSAKTIIFVHVLAENKNECMENLIGREVEIKILIEALASPTAELIAVYGRRRVGKTFLIREFFKNQLVFDFTGTKDAHLQIQLNNFFEEYLKVIGIP